MKTIAILRHPETTSCIFKFIEDELGCSPDVLGSNRGSTKAPCHSTSQMTELAKLSKRLDEADDTDIYEMTGY